MQPFSAFTVTLSLALSVSSFVVPRTDPPAGWNSYYLEVCHILLCLYPVPNRFCLVAFFFRDSRTTVPITLGIWLFRALARTKQRSLLYAVIPFWYVHCFFSVLYLLNQKVSGHSCNCFVIENRDPSSTMHPYSCFYHSSQRWWWQWTSLLRGRGRRWQHYSHRCTCCQSACFNIVHQLGQDYRCCRCSWGRSGYQTHTYQACAHSPCYQLCWFSCPHWRIVRDFVFPSSIRFWCPFSS